MTERTTVSMPGTKRVVLMAHDRRKRDLLEWVKFNVPFCGSTGSSPPEPPAGWSRRPPACR